jgi:hypothetical protein
MGKNVGLNYLNRQKNRLPITGRFAAMAGVARWTITAKLHRYCLVASVLRPATAASRLGVMCKRRTAQWDNEKRN